MLKSIYRLILICFLLGCVTYNQSIDLRQKTDPNAFETDGSKTVVKEASLIEMISGVSKTAGELLEKCAIPASIYDSQDAGFPKSIINTSPFACGLGNGAVDELKSIPQLVILATDIAFKEEVRDALVQQFKALTPSKVGTALVGFGKQTLGTIAGSTDKDFHSKGKMTFEVATIFFGGGATKAGDALKASDDMVTSLGKVTSRIDDMAGSPYKIFLAQTKNLRKLFEQLNPSQIKADDLNKFVDRLNGLPQGQARKDLFEALDGTDVKLDELDGYIKAVEADPSKLTKEKWEEFRRDNPQKLHVRAPRTLDQIAPNGKIPKNLEFNNWFDELTEEELSSVWNNDKLRSQIELEIRKPGGLHEWCMVCEVEQFKKWGVKMEDIKNFRTKTTELTGVNPYDGTPFAHSIVNNAGRIVSGPSSKTFHLELQNLIAESRNISEFNQRLTLLIQRWQIDPKLLPDFIK